MIQVFDGPERYGAFSFLETNALKAEIAGGSKQFVAMALSVFDVLDAITRADQELA